MEGYAQVWTHTTIITILIMVRGTIHLLHPVDGGRGKAQVRNSQNSDGSGRLQGGGGGWDPQKLDVECYN